MEELGLHVSVIQIIPWIDAYLHDKPITGMIYGNTFRSLPVERVQLKVGQQLHHAEVGDDDVAKVSSVTLPAGPVRVETRMLDDQGKPLTDAYYVYLRPE